MICDKYITESNETQYQEDYFHKVFSNQIDNDWIAQLSNRKLKMHLWPIIPKKYIIKFVRCNLSLPLINNQFNIPVFYIIRNPYDVIFSQNRVKFPWLYNLEHFRGQKLLTDLLARNYGFHWSELENFTKVEILCLRWCIENIFILEKEEELSETFKILRYEDLISDINMYYKLCDDFGLKPLKSIKSIYTRPSSKTHPESEIRNRFKQYKNEEDIAKITEILRKFNLTQFIR